MPVLVAESWGWPPAIAMLGWPLPPPPAPAPRRLELVRSNEARPTTVPGPLGWATPTAPSSENLGRGGGETVPLTRRSGSARDPPRGEASAVMARGAANLPRVAAAPPVGEKSSEGEIAAPCFVLKPIGTERASDGCREARATAE